MFSRNQAAGTAPMSNQPTVLAPPRAMPIPNASATAIPAGPGPAQAMAGPSVRTDDAAEVITLTKPLPGHTGDIYEIRLRPPTMGDWFEIGDIQETIVLNPGSDDACLKVADRPAVIGQWFQRLSGLHMATLAKLSIGDGRQVFFALKRLLGDLTQGNSQPSAQSSG